MLQQNKTYTRSITRDLDTNDLILDLGDELCSEAGWKVGDTLEWIDRHDGSWILRKVSTRRRISQWILNLINKIRQ